jgi:hypothetical protein
LNTNKLIEKLKKMVDSVTLLESNEMIKSWQTKITIFNWANIFIDLNETKKYKKYVCQNEEIFINIISDYYHCYQMKLKKYQQKCINIDLKN